MHQNFAVSTRQLALKVTDARNFNFTCCYLAAYEEKDYKSFVPIGSLIGILNAKDMGRDTLTKLAFK